MKNIIRGFIFWTIALVFILLTFAIGQALAKVVTMDLVINMCYVFLVAGIIYILKNI